jgi:hypothetical protein
MTRKHPRLQFIKHKKFIFFLSLEVLVLAARSVGLAQLQPEIK